MSKKVLIISWFYPPLNNTASKRAGCFSKYLPKFGWTPVVICPEWTRENCIYDPDYVRNIPEQVEIIRVPYKPYKTRSILPFLISKSKNLFLPHRFPFQWEARCREVIDILLQKNHFSAIWATSSIVADHVLAAWASSNWNIPWIADFRDIHGQYKRQYIGDQLKLPIRVYYEKRYIKTASMITTVSGYLAGSISRRHKKKVYVLPNGFDPDDAKLADHYKRERQEKFIITYAGKYLPNQQDLSPLLSSIEDIINNKQIKQDDISIVFLGSIYNTLKNKLAKFGFPEIISIKDRIPALECAKFIRNSTILLILAHNQERGIITSKIFEYLAARRPILAIPNDNGCVRDVLNRSKGGVSLSNKEEITRQLLDWYRCWEKSGTVPVFSDWDYIKQFSREEETRVLAKLLDDISRE